MNPESNYENLELNQDIGKENIEKIEKEINQFKEAVEAKFKGKDRERILSALDLMLYLHCDQEDRLDGKPYIIHPLEVADDLINKYEIDDADLVIGALFHDSAEDRAYKLLNIKSPDKELEKLNKEELQKLALAEIGNLYGERVQNMLRGLTNQDFGKMREELKEMGIQKKKKGLYKEHVSAATKNADVFVIKLSDFLRNAGNLPDDDFKRRYLIKKYGPVIRDIFIPAFEEISESHPLYTKRDEILAELNNIYETNYKIALEEINETRSKEEQY